MKALIEKLNNQKTPKNSKIKSNKYFFDKIETIKVIAINTKKLKMIKKFQSLPFKFFSVLPLQNFYKIIPTKQKKK